MATQRKVIKAYTAIYPDPIVVKAGELMKVGDPDHEQPDWLWCQGSDGKSGWVPKSYIDGETANRDYSAVELTAIEGEQLLFIEEQYGWAFCENERGDKGWIPTVNLEEL